MMEDGYVAERMRQAKKEQRVSDFLWKRHIHQCPLCGKVFGIKWDVFSTAVTPSLEDHLNSESHSFDEINSLWMAMLLEMDA